MLPWSKSMQVFFFIEQKVFTETHTTFVCIFLPKCQNRKCLLETKAPGMALLSRVSVFPWLSLFWNRTIL